MSKCFWPHKQPQTEPEQPEILRYKSTGKWFVRNRNAYKQRKKIRKTKNFALVRMRSAVRIRPAAPRNTWNLRISGVFLLRICIFCVRKNVGQPSAPHPEMSEKVWSAPDRKFCFLPGARSLFLAVSFYMTCSIKAPMVWAASSCFCFAVWG